MILGYLILVAIVAAQVAWLWEYVLRPILELGRDDD